jgi:hypothetical protein
MRKKSIFLALTGVTAAFAVGCEDGPNQTYNPAPAGAGDLWNNGGNAATTNDPGAQGYDAGGGGGTNSVNICTAAEVVAANTQSFNSPIKPPFSIGGMDISVNNTFAPFTIEMAQKGVDTTDFKSARLCQGASNGTCNDGTGNPAYAWGPSGQLGTCYDIATHQLTFFQVFPGYEGTLTATLPKTYNGVDVPAAVDQAGVHTDLTYVWRVGKAITENGKPVPLGFSHKYSGIDRFVGNKMYLALMYTFQKGLIALTDTTVTPPLNELTDPNYSCSTWPTDHKNCGAFKATKARTSVNSDDSGGNFGVRPVGIYFDAAQSNSADPNTAGAPSDIYMYAVKFVPYSLAPYDLGLDTYVGPNADKNLKYNGAPIYGPYSPAGVLKSGGNFCTLFMGNTWSNFINDCINVSGDPSTDDLSMKKLLGGQHHSSEFYQFSVVGVNQNWAADKKELTDPNGDPTVLADNTGTLKNPPQPDDVSGDFAIDVRASGAQLNDHAGNDATKGSDYHGTGTIVGYYRYLVLQDLRQQLQSVGITPTTDATATTCWVPAGASVTTWVAPPGCTGFEQMLSPAAATGATPAPFTDALDDPGNSEGGVFRPGDPLIDFLADPVGGRGFDAYIQQQNLIQASLQQVVAVIGHGDITKVPPAARDWRYFFRLWAQSYVKYMLNRGKDPTWHDLAGDKYATLLNLRSPDADSLFFDLQNGIDKFEYVDRSQAARLGAPLDVEYDMLINSSNLQNVHFFQWLTRAESALYSSMLQTKTDVPGSNNNVNVSDLFGSLAITNAGLFKPGKTTDAYTCATKLPTPADCPSGPPTDSAGNMLVDGDGQPLFTSYKGLVTGTTAFKIGNQLPITSFKPYIQSAILSLPNYADPYDTTSTNTPISVLVPWQPKQPGVGFEIPINAQRSQYIQTGSLDFSGVTITMNVDYIPVTDDKGNQFAKIAAVETQDFLGEVFPCVDANTGDILRVRMYSSTLDILRWFDNHPGTRTACNIVVRQSPYNNYPDYIVSVTNGVLLAVNPGAGGGPSRIADVTIFDPTLLTQLQ